MPRVIMPKMGDAMEEGTLLRWLKSEGEQVAQGEPIAEIETDKVNLEIESTDAGVMRKHLVEEGAVVPIGEAIAIVGDPSEPIEEAASQEKAAAATPASTEQAQRAEQAAPAVVSASQEPAAPRADSQAGAANNRVPLDDQVVERAPGERVRASPLVRRLAAEHGINLNGVRGTGPGGRIVKDDILPLVGQPQPDGAQQAPGAPVEPAERERPPAAVAVAQPEAAPDVEVRDLSRIRKTIARRMTESFQQAPHFYVTVSIDMGKALELRTQINGQVGESEQVSINDLIVKACAIALRSFPMLNASFASEQVRIHKRIDIGIAVAIEGGLISPFVPDADNKPLGRVAALTKDLAKRARDGGLKPEEYQGGTFTVSNLGMFGVDEFMAVINPPQAAILAVGSIKKEPVFQDGEFVPKDVMKVTLSADHRVTDGAEVARFLAEVRRLLESPMLLLVS